VSAQQLGALAIEEAMKRAEVGADEVDEVIMGNVLQAGHGQNPARQAMIYGGVPKETPSFTVNKLCASGLKAISLGAQAIQLGEAEVVIERTYTTSIVHQSYIEPQTITAQPASGVQPLTHFIFTGVFDRHRKLKVVSVENDAAWVAGILERMDYRVHRDQGWAGAFNGITSGRAPSPSK
jgi:hypothetical protein